MILRDLYPDFLQTPNDLLQQRDRFVELSLIGFGQSADGSGKGVDTALASLPHEGNALRRCRKADAAPVFGVLASHEARALEPRDDTAHRRGTHLLGVGQLAERLGPAED